MSNVATQPKPSVTAKDIILGQQTWVGPPPENYLPLTAEGLLVFCRSRLQEMDTAIGKKMEEQSATVALQDELTDIQAAVKAGDGLVNGNADVAYDNGGIVKNVSDKLDKAIVDARACGKEKLAVSLEAVKTKLHTGGDVLVTKEEVKDMSTMLDSALSTCRSGAEVSMIELQSLVSKRATMLQLTTGMMNSIDEAPKAIAGNIGR